MVTAMRSISRVLCGIVSSLVLVPGSAWANCAGDCDGKGGVAIDELITGVSMALEEAPMDLCPQMDMNGDQAVTVDEVVLALRDALRNCQTVLPFASIQKVFTQSCALSSCHSALARSGDLVLSDEELSYDNLVLRPADNPGAEAAGATFRVVPGNLEASYLVRKLRGLGPGLKMPVVGELNEETIHLIEDWIQRGAPSTQDECNPGPLAGGGSHKSSGDSANCDGQTPPPVGNYEWHPQEPLPAPAPGKGLQFHTPPRDVEPGREWETCFAFRIDPSQLDTAFVKRQEYRMHDGSHHLLLYSYFGQHPDEFTFGEYWDCFAGNCIDRSDCPSDSGSRQIPIGGTQVAGTSYVVEYPPGVGIPILGSVIIANLHYQNPFLPAQPIYGESWINLEVYEKGQFQVVLDGIFAINSRDLIVEPYETKTISRLWSPRGLLTREDSDVAIFQLFGHMHKRGIEFTIDFVDSDGAETQIYRTTEWDNAPVTDYPPPYLRVAKDQRLRWSCTHQNGRQGDPSFPPKRCHEGCDACGWDGETRTCIFTRDGSNRVYEEGDPMPLVFGALADDDMCNMFGYFVQQKDLAKIGK